jgi:hypothetical protein
MLYKGFFLFILVILQSCIDIANSENEIVKQRRDYKNIRNCILFIKNGGATVGDSYQISILSFQDKLSDSDTGNIFVADDRNGSISSDTSRINFEWIGLDTLNINFDKSLRVFKMKTKASDVTIIYDSLSLIK